MFQKRLLCRSIARKNLKCARVSAQLATCETLEVLRDRIACADLQLNCSLVPIKFNSIFASQS